MALSADVAVEALVLFEATVQHLRLVKRWTVIWVCLKIGYISNYSHLIGIMISKTIGYNGVHYFQTHPYGNQIWHWHELQQLFFGG